jgi:hypothetical protein
MDVRPPLIKDAQPTDLVQPSQCPLHHPPMDPQPTPVGGQKLRQDWLNPKGAQPPPMRFRAIGSVSSNLVWFTAGPAQIATHQMGHVNVPDALQVGDGPGHFEYPVEDPSPPQSSLKIPGIAEILYSLA